MTLTFLCCIAISGAVSGLSARADDNPPSENNPQNTPTTQDAAAPAREPSSVDPVPETKIPDDAPTPAE